MRGWFVDIGMDGVGYWICCCMECGLGLEFMEWMEWMEWMDAFRFRFLGAVAVDAVWLTLLKYVWLVGVLLCGGVGVWLYGCGQLWLCGCMYIWMR